MSDSATPNTASTMKDERQPNAACNTPPIKGAITGASAITEAISDNSRPARAPE